MLKKLLFLVFVVVAFVSCNNQPKETPKETTFELNVFDSLAPQYVNKEITILGTIDHVCKHGGKRMFLVGENPAVRVKINATDDNTSFKPEWEGSDVLIKGVVEELRIDAAYLDQWESEVLAETQGEAASKVHMGEPGHENTEGTVSGDIERINEFRQQIKDSGTDHVSFYSVNCITYEIRADEMAPKQDTVK
jgi:hypothetical protein